MQGSFSVAPLMETTAQLSLPPEILDLIVDHLQYETTTLKACCLVSKSWVPRTRKHLFARVEFHALQHPVELWKKAFPDPSSSPAHHTRTLCIRDLPTLTAADMDVGGWIRSFHSVVHLRLERIIWQGRRAPLIPFHGLAPTIRSLRLTSTSFEVFDLICSFPLLEDLALVLLTTGDADGWTAPSTSPKLTGSLELIMNTGGIRSVVRRLLDFPDGLRFVEITVSCIGEEDARSATDLVLRCFDTLEALAICGTPTGGFLRFLSLANTLSPVVDAGMPRGQPLLDLSKATKLKVLTFLCRRSRIKPIIVALQTVESKNLRQITIRLYTVTTGEPIEETVLQEWLDLDHLLVQFWTSHSIRPRLMYKSDEGWKDMRDQTQSLLPELTRRGLIDLVGYTLPLVVQ